MSYQKTSRFQGFPPDFESQKRDCTSKYTMLLCIAFRFLRFYFWFNPFPESEVRNTVRNTEVRPPTVPTPIQNPGRTLSSMTSETQGWLLYGPWLLPNRELQDGSPPPATPLTPLPTHRGLLTSRPGALNTFHHRNEILHYRWQVGVEKIILIVRPFRHFRS